MYAQFFYEDGDNFIEQDFYKKFLYEQVRDMKKSWETQNIPVLLWDMYYLLLLQDNNINKEALIYEIQRILAIPPSMIKSISKMFSTAKSLINGFIVSGIEPFKFGAISEISVILPML